MPENATERPPIELLDLYSHHIIPYCKGELKEKGKNSEGIVVLAHTCHSLDYTKTSEWVHDKDSMPDHKCLNNISLKNGIHIISYLSNETNKCGNWPKAA